MKIPDYLNIDLKSIEKRTDAHGNTYRISVLSKGENLFFQENDKYLFCLIDAANGVIEIDSITKWEPNKRMSPKERERVIGLIEKYYREICPSNVQLFSRRAQRREERLRVLLDLINTTEAELSTWKEDPVKIELSDPNGSELVDKRRQVFYTQYGVIIRKITGQIIQFFVKSEAHERQAIWEALSDTKRLKFHLHLDPQKEDAERWLSNRIMVLIISDLGADTRDVLMEIHALKQMADELKIDCKSVIKRHLHLTNTENKHGMGSMRTILERMVESN